MKAVILCNENEKMFQGQTDKAPIFLLRFCGKSLLEYAIDQLIKAEFHHMIISSYQSQDIIESELNDKDYNFNIDYSNTSPNDLQFLSNMNDSDDLLVLEANSIFNFDLKSMIKHHIINKNTCTILSTKQDNFYDFTCFSTGSDGYITSVIEKPSTSNNSATNVFSGIYIISKGVLSNYNFQKQGNFITDILPNIVSNNKSVFLFKEQGYYKKISSSKAFLNCQRDLLEGTAGIEISADKTSNGIYTNTDSRFNGVTIIPPVFIGKNVSIKSGSIINSGVVIEDNVSIESCVSIDNSYIGENSIINDNCKIDSSIICENSLLNKNIICEKDSYIGENVKIGNNSRIKSKMNINSNSEIPANSIVNNNINHKSSNKFYIDDDYECCFGDSKKMPYDISLLGMAIGTALNKSNIVVVGYEENKASKAISESLITGILSTGIKVFNISESTLQQTIFASLKLDCSICCHITADFSLKVKLFGKSGVPLEKSIERKIEKAYNKKSFRTHTFSNWGNNYEFFGASQLYDNFLLNLLPDKFESQNIRVKTSSLEIAKTADKLFYPRNNIDGEEITFHISDDGIKCTAYNDKTNFVTYEKLILLCIKIYKENGYDVFLSENLPDTAINFCKELNIKHFYSDESNKIKEQHLFTKDALMIISIISKYLSEKNIGLFEALKDIPDICVIERYISIKNNNKIVKQINDIVSNEYSNAKIKPLKSKTGILLFSENSKAEIASSVCDEIIEKIEKIKNNISF